MLALSLVLCLLQEGGLEVLEGETLYQEGWLFTVSDSFQVMSDLYDGSRRISDPLDMRRVDNRITSSVSYGALPNLTLTVLVPFVDRQLDSDAGDIAASGLGDVTLVAKWRLHRVTGDQTSDNIALLIGTETPTGSDDEKDGGVLVPMPLQPGSGSWDPFLGLAVTLEFGFWKFNAVALYQNNRKGGHAFEFGDEFVIDVSLGNRFHVEPYPGPAASLGFGLRWKRAGYNRMAGMTVADSGGRSLSARVGTVFHPTPFWDLVATLEKSLDHSVHGTQLVDDWSVFVAVGYRI